MSSAQDVLARSRGVERGALVLLLAALAIPPLPLRADGPSAQEIVRKSVANNTASWNAFPMYTLLERSVVTQKGHTTDTAYRVLMIDGSPYNRIVSVNNEPVPEQQQERKLKQEIARRHSQSAGERQARIAKFQSERQQDHALMAEMMNAFDYKLRGEETVDGRRCYVLDAKPKAGYQPHSRETKVLSGMRGTMWVDENELQWVRVHAEVFRPVAFGLFVAHVRPGTEFLLEMSPAINDFWLPKYFEVRVKANVLFWARESLEKEYYSDYRPSTGDEATAAVRR